MKHKYNFDGCGINRDGERIFNLTKWEHCNDKDIARFGKVAGASQELLEALEALLLSAESSNRDSAWATGIESEPESFAKARAALSKSKGQA